MEDKINEIKKQMEDATKQMNEKMDPILNNYESQINGLREQYNNRISELESQGFSSSDIYMDEQLINLNNEITRLTAEADRVFEDLNKELDGKIADLNTQLEFEEDKARRIGEKNKELDSRMNELEQEGLSYGEMQMDPEVLRIQKEIEEITNEMSESERKLLEQKEKEEKEEQEKNDAIKEYGDLKEQKVELESQLEEANRELEEQNASLEKEKAEREAVMRQLEERHNTDVPEYKECEADLRKIQEILDANSNKTKIGEITKNIDNINNRMAELETKYGKDVLEPVEPEIQTRQYGRRFNSTPQPSKQIPRDVIEEVEYDVKPLSSEECRDIAEQAYEMMTDEDKAYLSYARNHYVGKQYYEFMKTQFPKLFEGNSKEEQKIICNYLDVLYNKDATKDERRQGRRFKSEPQPKEQVPKDDIEKNTYDKEPLTPQECFEIAKASYDMMTYADKQLISAVMSNENQFYEDMRTCFPNILKGNSEIEQRMICDSLRNLYNHEFSKDQTQEAQGLEFQPQELEFQPQGLEFQPQGQEFQPQGQEFQPQGQEGQPQRQKPNLEDIIKKIEPLDLIVDLSTGKVEINLLDLNGEFKYNTDIKKELPNCKNLKEVKKFLAKENISYSENMDPVIVMALTSALDNYLEQLGFNINDLGMDICNPLIEKYAESLNARDGDITFRLAKIMYEKTRPDFVDKGLKGKGLDKELMPYIRQAKQSIYGEVNENIDTRTWFQKLADKVKSINSNKLLPAGKQKDINDHSEDKADVVEGEVVGTDKDDKEPKMNSIERGRYEFLKWQKNVRSKVVKGPIKDVNPKDMESQQQIDEHVKDDDHDEMEL